MAGRGILESLSESKVVEYTVSEAREVYPISWSIVPHPMGCALQLAAPNGVVTRWPMDWTILVQVKRMFADAKSSPTGPSANGEAL